MKILYDHQIFEIQKFGGISRIYCELMHRYSGSPDVSWELPIVYSSNTYLAEIPEYKNKILPIPNEVDYQKAFLFGYSFRGKRLLYELKKAIFPEPRPLGVSSVNKSNTISKLKDGNFDIFHPTYYDDYFLEYLGEKPFVLTVYDLIYQIFPEYYLHFEIDKNRALLNRASRILAISQSTKKDLISIFDVEESKIDVVYLGNSLRQNCNSELLDTPVSNLPDLYFLVVGSRTGYKNFLFLAQMFSALSMSEENIHLVCTGTEFSSEELGFFKKLEVSDKVHHYHVDDTQLAMLYKNALALIYPSQYEGFGLPILEAFSCGCPVLTGHNSSLVEIAGDAAIYFQEKNPQSLLTAMRAVLNQKVLRSEKIKLGSERLKEFSWQITADKTYEVYHKVFSEKR